MKYYINTFLFYSIIGFIIETSLKVLFFPSLNNGFLYGPWIPLYGFGVCIIIFIMRLIFNRFKVKRSIKIFLLFLISMIVLTTLELLSGVAIELLTGKVFWDYSKMPFNIGHYISMEISLVWGIMSLIIVYFLKPLFDKIIKKIPRFLTILISFVFIIDFFYSLINSL